MRWVDGAKQEGNAAQGKGRREAGERKGGEAEKQRSREAEKQRSREAENPAADASRPALAHAAQRREAHSSGQIGEPHVDRRERLGLRDLDERFAREFEHRDEIDDDDGHAARRVEQIGELHEARVLQLA